jgi:hypothetical protein
MLNAWKFPIVMSFVTTFFVTIVLVLVNAGYTDQFFRIWLRTWAIAFVLVATAIRYLAPFLRKTLKL